MTHTPATLAAAFKDAPTGIHNRSINRTVTLHEDEGGGKTLAVLTTSHHKELRSFTGAVRIERHEPPRDGGVFSVSTWIPFERTHNVRLARIPVGRYSNKALTQADAENVEMLIMEPDWLNQLDLGPYQTK